MRSLRILLPVIALAAVLVPVRAHATCGAEGCPLVRDGFGHAASRFGFDLRYQDVTQDDPWSGNKKADLADLIADAAGPLNADHGEVELYTRTRSWVAEGRVQLLPTLRLTATLPYLDREHRHLLAHFGSPTPQAIDQWTNRWKFSGLGDATVLASWNAWQKEGAPTIGVVGGAKLPTGKKHVDGEAQDNFGFESTLEPSARPGTGSTDWIAGLQLSQALPWARTLPLVASVQGRWNGKGTDDYKVGNEVQAGLSGGYRAMPWLSLLAQLNYAGHGSDESAEATEAEHSSMRSMYFTPGVSVRVTPMVAVYGLYQKRVMGHSDEATVVADDHFLIGTTLSIH